LLAAGVVGELAGLGALADLNELALQVVVEQGEQAPLPGRVEKIEPRAGRG
jgi:hypothetical protein